MFFNIFFFFFQAEDGIRDLYVTGVQTCALPISRYGLQAQDKWSRRLRQRHRGVCDGEDPRARYQVAEVVDLGARNGRVRVDDGYGALCPHRDPVQPERRSAGLRWRGLATRQGEPHRWRGPVRGEDVRGDDGVVPRYRRRARRGAVRVGFCGYGQGGRSCPGEGRGRQAQPQARDQKRRGGDKQTPREHHKPLAPPTPRYSAWRRSDQEKYCGWGWGAAARPDWRTGRTPVANPAFNDNSSSASSFSLCSSRERKSTRP